MVCVIGIVLLLTGNPRAVAAINGAVPVRCCYVRTGTNRNPVSRFMSHGISSSASPAVSPAISSTSGPQRSTSRSTQPLVIFAVASLSSPSCSTVRNRAAPTNRPHNSNLRGCPKRECGTRENRERHFTRPDLLIIDGFGFDRIEREQSPQGLSLLYKVIEKRGSRRSTALITTIDFEAWTLSRGQVVSRSSGPHFLLPQRSPADFPEEGGPEEANPKQRRLRVSCPASTTPHYALASPAVARRIEKTPAQPVPSIH